MIDPALPAPPVIVEAHGHAWALYPCPFCGSVNDLGVEIDADVELDPDAEPCHCFWVTCYDCAASGPGYFDAAEAVDAWNERRCPAAPHTN